MPPRRSHKKSRAGCRRCKSRKIKCDEVHPRCGNCLKHGVPCDFEHPELTESLNIPDTPGSFGAPSPSFSNLSSGFSPAPGPSVAARTLLTICRNPDPPAFSAASKNNRLMELKLLHHYTTMTCKTLTICDPSAENIWRDTVPSLAFSGNSFLVDALLSVSALHLRAISPHDQQLVQASHAYMASTLSDYGSNLSKGINASNAEALFLTAALIAFQSTASRIFVRDNGGDVKSRSNQYTLPLSWFHAFQGVKAVVASSWQWLRNSGIVVPIIQGQPALNLNLSSQESTYFANLLVGLDGELESLESDPASHMLTRQAYQHAVAVLNWAHKIPLSGAPMVFLATVSRRYVELLQARRPRALAILACFFGLLKCLDGVWWLRGVARREVLGIVHMFDPDDQVWWPRLQWPLRVVLHDGDVIPPEVWGADWEAESVLLDQANRQNGGGFINHIEMLSQMFAAMQNLPPGLPADTVNYAYSGAEQLISAQLVMARQEHGFSNGSRAGND
ncbi:uncharacterized protein BCR38DRAFT_233406 [Pseudomassariella vexata]|uniref:Zn(2)-C6 fungal-type domain-containing protein n=1 Tax=Pseudomassariella vexata TaxID=1141098 RepID=A0A1Y2DSL2_9PEZI|nr:uncharacterized protein BCR38DRAFT_233406 [Pseudomassariella vexata]ORY62139.1 hypothetical protein BCR38DRAFT_233406 [Pseudomassariella vexata]